MKTYMKKWFTLVELLVVVTVLSILASIAYIGIDNYFASSRDSKRIYDMQQITNVMQLYFNGNSEYPEPSDAVEVTFSGALAWKQGTFWASVTRKLRSFWNDIPLDPLHKNEYSYSLTNMWTEYQIGMMKETFKETEGLGELALINKANAANIPGAFISWNYNGFIVRVIDGSINYFIASPSIIASDLTSTDVLDIMSERKLAYQDFFNLPASYSEFENTLGGFDFNVSDPLVFSGNLNDLKSEQALLDFDAKLKYVYATTPTESFAKYISLLQEDSLTNIKSFLTRKFKILFRTYFNCKDILDDGASRGDGEYEIDPDGDGWQDPYMVYCDMTTDGGWWTRVGGNHLLNADFSWGTHIIGAEQNTSLNHSIISLWTEVDENQYALKQTGNYSSYYKLWFPDESILRQGYEIRMTAWRSDSSSEWPMKVTLMWGKNTPWTLGTCTTGNSLNPSCYFSNFNRKLLYAPNFWAWWILSNIDISVKAPTTDVTTSYLDGGVLFDGFIPSSNYSSSYGWVYGYTQAEKEAIDAWVRAWWFLISTNNESTWDPLWEYFGMPTIQYGWNQSVLWDVENIDHPLVNGSIGLGVDLRGQSLVWAYARAALGWTVLPGDIILARDRYNPKLPTVLLRRHGQGHILFVSDDGMFMQMWGGNTFDASNNQTVFASNIMTFAIETAAGINPREWYIFHNRLYYSDGTFSANGEDVVLDTITVEDDGVERTWTKEQVRHTIYKNPESFSWFLGLDANNNKELYYTWLKLELYYR